MDYLKHFEGKTQRLNQKEEQLSLPGMGEDASPSYKPTVVVRKLSAESPQVTSTVPVISQALLDYLIAKYDKPERFRIGWNNDVIVQNAYYHEGKLSVIDDLTTLFKQQTNTMEF